MNFNESMCSNIQDLWHNCGQMRFGGGEGGPNEWPFGMGSRRPMNSRRRFSGLWWARTKTDLSDHFPFNSQLCIATNFYGLGLAVLWQGKITQRRINFYCGHMFLNMIRRTSGWLIKLFRFSEGLRNVDFEIFTRDCEEYLKEKGTGGGGGGGNGRG